MSNVVVSFPKSGRTWLRVMIGFLFCKKFGYDTKHALDKEIFFDICDKYPLFLHDDINRGWSLSVEKKIDSHINDKVIYLYRDVRDVMVSYYFHRKHRTGEYKKDISNFIKDEIFGVDTYLSFHKKWIEKNDGILHISYEEMSNDCLEVLLKVRDYFCIENVDEFLEEAVAFGSFANMRKMEKNHHLGKRMLSPKNKNDFRTYKTRSGKTGGYIDYFSKIDLDYIKNKEEEYGFC